MLHHSTPFYTTLSNLPQGQLFVLTDSHTTEYCLPLLAEFIGDMPYHLLTLEAGERSKTLASVQRVWDFLLQHRATREALLINLGGGMVTDLGGFAAATYMRGIRFVNIPTTLLAMVDASSGGKTGVDYQGIKNVIGTFTPPLATLIHPPFLLTLPATELLSGFAEMLKHALIASPEEWIKLLQLTQQELPQAQFVQALSERGFLHNSIAIKEQIVAQDPREAGMRKILNFGHTVGHAIESAALHNSLQPSTFNPQPSTFNPQPSTFHPQPSTFNLQPSTYPLPRLLRALGHGGRAVSKCGACRLSARGLAATGADHVAVLWSSYMQLQAARRADSAHVSGQEERGEPLAQLHPAACGRRAHNKPTPQ